MTRRGFTVMEVMVVVAMMGVVVLMTAPFLAGGVSRGNLKALSIEAADALHEAQSAAMSGKENARYGVHFQSDRFVLFQGATYNPAEPTNRVRLLDGDVSVTAVALSPGGACTVVGGSGNCDVHFADHRGVPAESGTVTFTDSAGTAATLTLNGQGMIDVN